MQQIRQVAGTLFVIGLLGTAAAAPGPVAGASGSPLFIEIAGVQEFSGRLLVRPRHDLSPARDAAARARLLNAEHIDATDEYLVPAPAARAGSRGSSENALAEQLIATGDYEYAHPDWICYPAIVPDDPSLPNQWHLAKMNCPAAWDTTPGSSQIILAFTDSGIDINHPDLAARRVPGYDAFANLEEVNGGSVDALNNHGTHVAGCGAAVGNNATGVAGVAWGCSLMMVRVAIDSGGGAFLSDILEGARWAADHGARVVSTSYTGVQNASVQTTGEYIRALDALYLYAAANNANYWVSFDHPDVMVVGASDPSDARASFSGWGPGVDIFAPGTDILSTCVGADYCYNSGTSMATPVANGVLGLIFAANPSLAAWQAEAAIFNTCFDMGLPGDDPDYGHGRADAAAAVALAVCVADFNKDGFTDALDYDSFINSWLSLARNADVNNDEFVDAIDYDLFITGWLGGGC